MRYLLPLLLFFVCSCTHKAHRSGFLGLQSTPCLIVQPVEDRSNSPFSKKTASYLNRAIADRLKSRAPFPLIFSHKGIDELSGDGGEFYVSLQLMDTQQLGAGPTEVSLSVLLSIYDLRGKEPQVLLQEVINHTTLLKGPITSNQRIGWEEEGFRVSPLGLSLAKLSREIATRLEDCIMLSTKG